jgi:hypothetical protein
MVEVDYEAIALIGGNIFTIYQPSSPAVMLFG